jgi:uroporphyrinogen-III synthase
MQNSNPNPVSNALAGVTIAVPETREIDQFARMLEEHSASVVRCPLIGILDAPDAAPIEQWLRVAAAKQFHDIIFLTGEGARRLMGFAERAGIAAEVRAGFAHARKVTRGPKPAKVLKELDLKPDVPSIKPTTEGVIETLRQFDLTGRTVGVQLYGEDPNLPLIQYLESAGAIARPVAPYIYAPAAHDQNVVSLITQMCGGKIDVLAFTSAAQVKRLSEVAEEFKLQDQLKAGFERTRIAAVGPVVAEELAKQNTRVDIVPRTSFFLRQLVKDIIAAMSEKVFKK